MDDETAVGIIRDGIARGWWDVEHACVSDRARRKSWWAAATVPPVITDPASWKRKPWWVRQTSWDFAYALSDVERFEYWPERRVELTRAALDS